MAEEKSVGEAGQRSPLLDAAGAERAHIIGHDWGASAAYGAAALHPHRVTKLFAIGIPHPAALKPSPKKLWGARHFAAYKLPGAPKRFAGNDFAALPAIYRRWSPTWNPDPSEFDAVRASFANPASLNAAFGYYRKLSLLPSQSLKARITVPTVVFAGLDDPIVTPADYRGAARMFAGEYLVEDLLGAHEAFLASTVREVQPVSAIDGRPLPEAPGLGLELRDETLEKYGVKLG